MNFNFKKNNLLIILLLILVILSCIVYINMINVKEGLANIASVKISDIKHGDYLTEIGPNPADPSYTYYKLAYPVLGKYKLTDGIAGLPLRQYPDFSINDATYTSSTIANISFIDYHSKYGMLGVSDISNAQFYHYNTTINSILVLNIDLSYSAATSVNNFNMLIKEFSGNIYEPSSNIPLTNLYVNLKIPESPNVKPLIAYGKFVLNPVNPATPDPDPDPVIRQIQYISGGTATATATGGSVTLGDTNLNLGLLSSLFGADNRYSDSELYAYLLQDGG